MFDDIEYIDPEDSKCDECGCSFDVHLTWCSYFRPHPATEAEKGPR
jgi:hypothetical protein